MTPPRARFYFDYVDPLSFLMERELRAAEHGLHMAVERVPLELNPPPAEMIDPDDPAWQERLASARRAAAELGVEITLPSLVPWTRKAHELVLFAADAGRGPEMHRRLFEAVFQEGRDVGRVDVLVSLAQGLGFDFTETKAALDVDRYTEALQAIRHANAEAGVMEAPTLLTGGRQLQGFHNRNTIGTFLHAIDN